jgi:hypothetical protein
MDAESWLTGELASFGCAACGEAYGRGHVRLIAQRDELFFVDLSCDHCGSQAVAIVTIQIEGGSTKLQTGELVPAAEFERFHHQGADDPGVEQAAPVSADDVIDAHALLEHFEGDVHQLFARFDGEGR